MNPQQPQNPARPRVVIDTNAVLDCFWFADPATVALTRAISSEEVDWISSAEMRLELDDVLLRPHFQSSEQRGRESVLASFDRWCKRVNPIARVHPLTCRDPDDQMFIDLAVGHDVRWLVTRDRALLSLGPRAMSWNCSIVAPVDWHLATAT